MGPGRHGDSQQTGSLRHSSAAFVTSAGPGVRVREPSSSLENTSLRQPWSCGPRPFTHLGRGTVFQHPL